MSNGVQQKNPIVAAILSFFFPGLGQVYNGQGIVKGLMYLIAMMIGLVLLFIPGIIVYFYCIYKAYSGAKKVNEGILPYKKAGIGAMILFVLLEVVIIFGFSFVIGLVLTALTVLLASMSSGGY